MVNFKYRRLLGPYLDDITNSAKRTIPAQGLEPRCQRCSQVLILFTRPPDLGIHRKRIKFEDACGLRSYMGKRGVLHHGLGPGGWAHPPYSKNFGEPCTQSTKAANLLQTPHPGPLRPPHPPASLTLPMYACAAKPSEQDALTSLKFYNMMTSRAHKVLTNRKITKLGKY